MNCCIIHYLTCPLHSLYIVTNLILELGNLPYQSTLLLSPAPKKPNLYIYTLMRMLFFLWEVKVVNLDYLMITWSFKKNVTWFYILILTIYIKSNSQDLLISLSHLLERTWSRFLWSQWSIPCNISHLLQYKSLICNALLEGVPTCKKA